MQNWDLGRIGDISSEKLERNMRELEAFMDSDLRQMRTILKKYAPLEMMKLACWDRWRMAHGDNAWAWCNASAFVRFLQNAYVLSQTYEGSSLSSDRNIANKDYKRLATLFDDFAKRTQRYVDNAVLSAKNLGGIKEQGIVSQMQTYASDLCFPPVHSEKSIPARARVLRISLFPFQGLIDSAFHAGLDGIIDAFTALERGALLSLEKLRSESKAYQSDLQGKIRESKEMGQVYANEQERIDAIITREHWHDRVDSLMARRDGYALYDVQSLTGLDGHDCASLSLDIASVEGEYTQYPFEKRATREYPFVRGTSKFFCFDADHLLDDGYWIIKELLIRKGYISREEWDATEKENRLLQPVTIIHSLFGATSFEMHKGEYDAVFDFPHSQVGLVVVNPIESDPFKDGGQCIREIDNGITRMGQARGRQIPAIVIDATMVGNYPLQLQDGVLYLTLSQFLRITQEPEAIKQCKALFGIGPEACVMQEPSADQPEQPEEPQVQKSEEPEEPAKEITEKGVSQIEAETERRGSDDKMGQEESQTTEEEKPDEPNQEQGAGSFSLFSMLKDIAHGNANPSYAAKSGKEEKADTPPTQEAEPERRGSDDKSVQKESPITEEKKPDEPKQEQSSGSFSLFSMLKDIAQGNANPSYAQKQPSLLPQAGEEEDEDLSDEAEEEVAESLIKASEEEEHDLPVDDVPSQEEEENEVANAISQEESSDAKEKGGGPNEEERQEVPVPGQEPASSQPSSTLFSFLKQISQEKNEEAETPVNAPVGEEILETPVLEDLESVSPIDVALEGKSIPSRFREILEGKDSLDGAFFAMCKNESDKFLLSCSALIDKALLLVASTGKDKMFTIAKYSLTFVIASRSDDELSRYDRKENIGAMMYMEKKNAWNSLTLFYDKAGALLRAQESTIRQEDYSPLEWRYAVNIGKRILAKRKGQRI